MTGFKRPNVKHLMLFSGRAYPELADEVSEILDVDIVPTRAISYANSEIYVRFEESVRGSDAFVLQSHAAPVNEWLMEQLIMNHKTWKQLTKGLPAEGIGRTGIAIAPSNSRRVYAVVDCLVPEPGAAPPPGTARQHPLVAARAHYPSLPLLTCSTAASSAASSTAAALTSRDSLAARVTSAAAGGRPSPSRPRCSTRPW